MLLTLLQYNSNTYLTSNPHDSYLPLKQKKNDIGIVKTMSAIEPTVAKTSMKPPRCPSAVEII